MKDGTSAGDAVVTRLLKAIAMAFCIFIILIITPPADICGEVLERIVAIVNDDIILLSEFEEALTSAEKSGKEVNRDKVLSGMIDDVLLLQEAARFRVGSGTSYESRQHAQALIKEFINIKIRAFIHIPQKEIEDYYRLHRDSYPGKEFFDVRDEIEGRLVKEALKTRFRDYMEELRERSYVRIQL